MKQVAKSYNDAVDPAWRIGIVFSSYYKEQIERLRSDAVDTLITAGIPPDHILEYEVPGSFEVPLIGAELARSRVVDALIGFGIIVEGETHHARLLADAAAAGMMRVQVEHGVPFAFEILYVNDLEQAEVRSRGNHGKGKEAAYAVLHSLAALKAIRSDAN